MAVEIAMPQLSDTMSEGKILVWRKKEGDDVKRGEALAEVATDKADLEIESFHQGKLLKILSPAGETVKVGSIIAVIGEAGEAAESSHSLAPQPTAPQQATSQAVAPPLAPVAIEPEMAVASASHPQSLDSSERVKISPLAKNYALSQGVDFTQIEGTGDGGRIIRRDIERYLGSGGTESRRMTRAPVEVRQPAHAPAPTLTPAKTPEQVVGGSQELSKMRQTISARMVESKTTIPHFYMTAKVNVDALAKLRETLKPLPQYEGVTYNHLIVKAAALALRAVPRINASYRDGALHQPSEINVGIVTAVQDGLLIPVLKRADQLTLVDIVQEAKGLVQRARAGRPKADDLSGGTFSISNVGPFPVESFSAIISPGQGAILAVSAIQDEPILRDGAVVPGKVLRVTLSVDHRIIDGVIAGEFLKELCRVIEEPVLLLA